MDRRLFMARTGGVATLIGLSGLGLHGCRVAGPLTHLESQLATLADDWFSDHARTRDQNELLISLTNRGVITLDKGIIHARLQELAQTEPLVAYRNFYYTPSELDLYALAFLVTPDTLLGPSE